jgi:hypothetical protein
MIADENGVVVLDTSSFWCGLTTVAQTHAQAAARTE